MSLNQSELSPPPPAPPRHRRSSTIFQKHTSRAISITEYPLQNSEAQQGVEQAMDMLLDVETNSRAGDKDREIKQTNHEQHESDPGECIILSEEDKKRIYRPWAFSIIIKVLGKRINHQYLKKRLYGLWKSTEEIVLIDLGHDYYIVKFYKEENMQRAMQNGPWFINDYFLSVKR